MTPVWYNDWDMKADPHLHHDRIVADPRILADKPIIKGTRIGSGSVQSAVP